MKKFYIPTTTLNFNNILSSESVSPKAFYDKRGFGYRRWETIAENPFGNAVVLYEEKYAFDRPKSEVEDHPLLIEVELDEAGLKKSEGFCYCDHTIYLTPEKTKFIFFSEQDRRVTLSMSESSLETKLLKLYQGSLVTETGIQGTYNPPHDGEPCALNEAEMEKDVRINKMKGLLYGYYIGALLSSDTEDVKALNALKEIHRIFAAIRASQARRPTDNQDETLDNLFRQLNPKYRDLGKVIGASIDNKKKTEKVWKWVNGFIAQAMRDGRNPLDEGVGDKSVCLAQLQQPEDNDKENPAIEWIKSKITDAEERMKTKRHRLSPDDSEIVVMGNRVSTLKHIADEKEKQLCLAWLNETLSDKNTNGKISTYNTDLAVNLTLKAKEVYSTEWEGSHAKVYLNDLRRHVGGDVFVHPWDNGVLSSIAAVVMAGDDWRKLCAYMQSKEMTNYKLAFAFYGTLNGFANLTRDFTDLLYEQEDKEYVREVYAEFHGQLFGDSCASKYAETKQTEPERRTAKSEDVQTPSDKEEREIPGDLKQWLECAAWKEIPEKAQQYYKKESLGLYKGKVDQSYIDALNKLEYSKTKTKWKKIVKQLESGRNNKTRVEPERQESLFVAAETNPVGKFFYCDRNAWYHIEPLVITKEQLKKDLDWFQQEYKEGRSSAPKDNISVIEHFENYLWGKKRSDSQWLKDAYRDIDVGKIINKLRDLYQ